MNIGELAQRTGLAPSRIHSYESAGLLKTVTRPHADNRTYLPEAMLALTFITAAQQAGFGLDEIRPLLPLGRDGWDPSALLAALRRKVEKIQSLEARLAHSKAQLVALMRDAATRPDGADRELCAQRVLARVMGRTA